LLLLRSFAPLLPTPQKRPLKSLLLLM